MGIKGVPTNLEIAELLRGVAAAYELQNEKKNKFKIVAYERAADSVEHASSELKDLWDEGKLSEVAGIGPGISSHLDELFSAGHSKHFDELLSGLPKAVFKLMELPGIGVKTAYKLVKSLNISDKNSYKDLEKAAKQRKIEKLENFGEKSQEDILKTLGSVKKRLKRYLIPYASTISEEVINWLRKDRNILKVEVLGSLRRKASTVGDIDIAIATNNPTLSLEHFSDYPKKQRVLEKGDVSASILVSGGMQVDVIALPANEFGSLLQHFTGSKHHNIALREYALKKGMSLSERGIKTKDGKNLQIKDFSSFDRKTKIYEFDSENGFYNALGLKWIPPELREDNGEIEASLRNNLPKLLQLNEVKADLQIHSDFDIETSHDLGLSPAGEIIKMANNLGYEYIAFTEHNPSRSRHTTDQIYDILIRKREWVQKLNSNLKKGTLKRVFNSLEIDILPDGNLPLGDRELDTLDFALVSIHSSFNQEKQFMTKRILKALEHPKVKIWAHPTGRLLQKREGIEADFDEIFSFMVKHRKCIEINADPMRLDLPDFLVKEALSKGILFTLGTDSHHVNNMDNMKWGVSVARRGWLKPQDVINTFALKKVVEVLEL